LDARKEETDYEEEVDELERRWLVLEVDDDTQGYPFKDIEQGFLPGAKGTRIRIIDDKEAVMSRKTGKGRGRRERNKHARLSDAKFLMEDIREKVEKRRHLREGWEVDYFKGPLQGVILAEIEKPTMAELAAVTLPPWIRRAVEVTDSLTNRMLARVAARLDGSKLPDDLTGLLLPRQVRHIALSGGPCSGKSAFMKDLKGQPSYRSLLHAVPETATYVIKQVEADPPIGDWLAMREYQRTIYDLQLLFEHVALKKALRTGKQALLLDRGTVDGAAYMTHGLTDLPVVFGSTLQAEYARYHGIIFMELPPREIYDARKSENEARYETYDEAVVTSEKLYAVWKDHPRFRFIANGAGWDDKAARARAALDELLSSQIETG
jgi:CYTH domain-containing protein/predicted ATPase